MMTLKNWIAVNCADMTRAATAKRLGIAACYLSQILNGDRVPGRTTQHRIYENTGGAVTPDSWLPNPPISPLPPEIGEEEIIEP